MCRSIFCTFPVLDDGDDMLMFDRKSSLLLYSTEDDALARKAIIGGVEVKANAPFTRVATGL